MFDVLPPKPYVRPTNKQVCCCRLSLRSPIILYAGKQFQGNGTTLTLSTEPSPGLKCSMCFVEIIFELGQDRGPPIHQISPRRDPPPLHVTKLVQEISHRQPNLASSDDPNRLAPQPPQEFSHPKVIVADTRSISYRVNLQPVHMALKTTTS